MLWVKKNLEKTSLVYSRRLNEWVIYFEPIDTVASPSQITKLTHVYFLSFPNTYLFVAFMINLFAITDTLLKTFYLQHWT